MVRVDFSQYRDFDETPIWWQNFIKHVRKIANPPDFYSTQVMHIVLNRELEYHKCKLGLETRSIEYLEFEMEEDFLLFKLKWQ